MKSLFVFFVMFQAALTLSIAAASVDPSTKGLTETEINRILNTVDKDWSAPHSFDEPAAGKYLILLPYIERKDVRLATLGFLSKAPRLTPKSKTEFVTALIAWARAKGPSEEEKSLLEKVFSWPSIQEYMVRCHAEVMGFSTIKANFADRFLGGHLLPSRIAIQIGLSGSQSHQILGALIDGEWETLKLLGLAVGSLRDPLFRHFKPSRAALTFFFRRPELISWLTREDREVLTKALLSELSTLVRDLISDDSDVRHDRLYWRTRIALEALPAISTEFRFVFSSDGEADPVKTQIGRHLSGTVSKTIIEELLRLLTAGAGHGPMFDRNVGAEALAFALTYFLEHEPNLFDGVDLDPIRRMRPHHLYLPILIGLKKLTETDRKAFLENTVETLKFYSRWLADRNSDTPIEDRQREAIARIASDLRLAAKMGWDNSKWTTDLGWLLRDVQEFPLAKEIFETVGASEMNILDRYKEPKEQRTIGALTAQPKPLASNRTVRIVEKIRSFCGQLLSSARNKNVLGSE